jgi:hypothetical protein
MVRRHERGAAARGQRGDAPLALQVVRGRDEHVPHARRELRWRVVDHAHDGDRAPGGDLAVHLRLAGEVREPLEHRDDDRGHAGLDGEGELLDHVRELDQQGLTERTRADTVHDRGSVVPVVPCSRTHCSGPQDTIPSARMRG